jgi:hypothetical protein
LTIPIPDKWVWFSNAIWRPKHLKTGPKNRPKNKHLKTGSSGFWMLMTVLLLLGHFTHYFGKSINRLSPLNISSFTKSCSWVIHLRSFIVCLGPDPMYTLEGLRPDTGYTIRVQAVNSIGPGPFCPGSRFHTRPLPPAPPKCELANANFNSLKLKWGEGLKHSNGELCHYTLEMENSRNQ